MGETQIILVLWRVCATYVKAHQQLQAAFKTCFPSVIFTFTHNSLTHNSFTHTTHLHTTSHTQLVTHTTCPHTTHCLQVVMALHFVWQSCTW